MINKKICLLGAFAVGKTALVNKYVSSIFSDEYLSTVGVKISKKSLTLGDAPVNLILWDLEGKDLYTEVNISYLRGAMGFLLVADGTRRETVQVALDLRNKAIAAAGDIPHILLINKADLVENWEITKADIEKLTDSGIIVFETSAKTGRQVEDAFILLAQNML